MKEHRPSYDCYDCSHEHEKHENKVVLNCGTGAGVSLPVGGIGPAWQPGLIVGTVTLDTRGLKKPTVKIDFSSVVSFRANSFLFEIAIIFQLSRSCNNGQKIPLANWTYEREVGLGVQAIDSQFVEFKDPIAFTWCDCHDCPGCCTYLVEIIDIDTEYIESASVTNVGINAIAVSGD